MEISDMSDTFPIYVRVYFELTCTFRMEFNQEKSERTKLVSSAC